MTKVEVIDVNSQKRFKTLLDDIYKYNKVIDVQYSTYILSTIKGPEVRYTALVTYIGGIDI